MIYMINTVIVLSLIYQYNKTQNSNLHYVASILNLLRQCIRMWDIENTQGLMEQQNYIIIQFFQLNSSWMMFISLIICFSDKRGSMIITQIFFINLFFQFQYLNGAIKSQDDVFKVAKQSYPLIISFFVVYYMCTMVTRFINNFIQMQYEAVYKFKTIMDNSEECVIISKNKKLEYVN